MSNDIYTTTIVCRYISIHIFMATYSCALITLRASERMFFKKKFESVGDEFAAERVAGEEEVRK